jgi:dihydropyrimidinase
MRSAAAPRPRPKRHIARSLSPTWPERRVYIVHLSNEAALAELKFMQARGARALAETCTQYLVLSIDDQMPGKSWDEAKYVFTPPLREKWNQQPLWEALGDGSLAVVSTDHCPFRFADQKSLGRDDFRKIPNGGPGIENRLQILWHYGVNAGRITAEQFVELTATAPARIFGMGGQKGSIAPGLDADILLWDPNAQYTISAATQRMATDYSMFEGWQVRGNAAKVFSRGELVVDNMTRPGQFLGATGRGRFVRRQANAGGLA